ncbi:metalloregulator ArsR/SmtB family transcription factor [Oceanotoga sp. DSM 15011]|uniref:ArsR family transcriptional regulator n=1 Tax=Oceanotoga teriensis TaxID=515440 RepID=A0AA45HIN3_9BACT|nr:MULTISPECIES: metalloregulator ArsR/SmtB family transcription factor [Oceanotoga]MDO7975925.1 metalloregulator ArsR/SmtB family transcription factor [Oceanotoga teriensis]PWJ95091.1 ArsR family transcriptional regulator [Oceanotoga teriensis]UYO99087.1 metalloregulator ArsR/SmtB family transcription factor [Oceanotoga sp. DSM 15011]
MEKINKPEKKETDVCKNNIVHRDILEQIKDKIPADEILFDLADFFKIFGDTTRIKILNLLFQAKELCVCDISIALNMSQSSISHQLRVLRQAKVVKYRKDGKVVYYSLDDEHIEQIFNTGMEHITEETF